MSFKSPRFISALLILSLGLAGGSVSAQGGSLEKARKSMELGQASFAAGSFAAAGVLFLDAYAASPFPAFLYNAALATEKGGDNAKAVELYERFLAEEPGTPDADEIRAKIRALEPASAPATRVEVVEVQPEAPAKPAAAEEMKSLVSVRVNPASAKLRILDAAGKEVSAFSGENVRTVVRGEYAIEASHPDYKTVTTHLSVVPGQVYVVVVEMSQGAFLGFLGVATDPPGAQVFIDDKAKGAVGSTPWGNVLPPGKHELWVEKPGFSAIEREIVVEVGDKQQIEIPLERLPIGVLIVKANLSGAAVYLDGKLVGTAPLEIAASPGVHALRVTAEDMKDYVTDVEIERGRNTKALVRMNPEPSRTPAWVSGGFAVALFAAGGAFGGVALHLDRELDADRKAGRLADDDPRIVHGFLWALGADISFGLGAVMSGLCLYYFLRDPLPPSEGKLSEPVDMTENPSAAADDAAPSARKASGIRFAVAPLVAKDAVGLGLAVSY